MSRPGFKSKPQRLKPRSLFKLNRHEWNSCPTSDFFATEVVILGKRVWKLATIFDAEIALVPIGKGRLHFQSCLFEQYRMRGFSPGVAPGGEIQGKN